MKDDAAAFLRRAYAVVDEFLARELPYHARNRLFGGPSSPGLAEFFF